MLELVLGLMCVSPQVPDHEMLPLWCLVLLGGLLPPCQGLLNLGSALGLGPAQPSDGELGGFPRVPGEGGGTSGHTHTLPDLGVSSAMLGSWSVLLLIRGLPGSAPWGTSFGQANVAEPTSLVNEIFPTVQV